MRVCALDINHLKSIQLAEDAYEEYDKETVMQSALDEWSRGSDVVSLVDDTTIYGVFGIRETAPGVGEAWALISPKTRDKYISFHRLVLSLIAHYERELSLHRLQAAVRCDFAKGKRWLESLGFLKEGVMRKYSPNQLDYQLFARVR